jgi:hypothetical protein
MTFSSTSSEKTVISDTGNTDDEVIEVHGAIEPKIVALRGFR